MSEKKKIPFNRKSPESKSLIDEIVHGTFVKEGTMVAFPTCFPGASVSIPGDESRITSLDITQDGIVYGGTSGRATHLFVAMFHGATGIVFDRGVVQGATHCASICCGKQKFLACVNDPDGGRIVAGGLDSLPFDLIQEWGFSRAPFQEVGRISREPIIHAVADLSKNSLIGITASHLFMVDFSAGKIEKIEEIPGRGRIAVGTQGGIYGQDGPECLWRFDVASKRLQRQAVKLPEGRWNDFSLTWARDHHDGLLYTADADGTLFSFAEERGFSAALGRTMLATVGPMAVTHDGRVFGFCGSEMSKMFSYHPGARAVTNLGVAISVIERRRYGYVFGDAVTGRDGQIIFGENDDLGHLWLYFPRIQARA